MSQVVVWDKIIENKKDAKLNLKGEFLDYPLRDPARELRCVFLILIYPLIDMFGKLLVLR